MNEEALKKQAHEAMLADYNSAGYGVNSGSQEEARVMNRQRKIVH